MRIATVMFVTGSVRLAVLQIVERVSPLAHAIHGQARVRDRALFERGDVDRTAVAASQREPERFFLNWTLTPGSGDEFVIGRG